MKYVKLIVFTDNDQLVPRSCRIQECDPQVSC